MKIARVETIPIAIPLRRSMAIASGAVAAGNHVIVRIHTDEGTTGIGEASPVASTDADTQRSIVHVIADRLAPVLQGPTTPIFDWQREGPLSWVTLHE